MRWFCTRRAFGFIRAHDSNQDVFFHKINLFDASRIPQTGDRVEFRLIKAAPSNCAVDVTLVPSSSVKSTNKKIEVLDLVEPGKKDAALETDQLNANINTKGRTLKLRKKSRRTKRRLTRKQPPVKESDTENRSPTVDNELPSRRENLNAEDSPSSDDDLVIGEENCFPLCSLGQVQRQKIGPSSSVYPNPTPSTSSLTDTSRRNHVGC